ncbi:hypothetical protein HHK36_022870 [Tetracentron sinense]|uniref:Uncharacterized protein n=1 Tax=Tetracentron sinense TaxID=13715 RepID=A0A834YVL3_TETSI|nr:hypothetical protein HHK36_022870 [Tetracentron sinense]
MEQYTPLVFTDLVSETPLEEQNSGGSGRSASELLPLAGPRGEADCGGLSPSYKEHPRLREDGGYEVIKKAILNLSPCHKDHIGAYREGNEQWLMGKHKTANTDPPLWRLLIAVARSTWDVKLRNKAKLCLQGRLIG